MSTLSNQQKWIPYQLNQVVNVNDADLSRRNYIEQEDLKGYLRSVSDKIKISKIIEFGCGYGRMTQVLTEFTNDVVGIEREPFFVNKACKLIPNITFIQAEDLSSVPFKNKIADIIITFTFLQHLIEIQAIKVIKEIIRCLKPGGYVLICEETDEEIKHGDIYNLRGANCCIGRSLKTYCNYFKPLSLEFTASRRVEPTFLRKNVGMYMLFKK